MVGEDRVGRKKKVRGDGEKRKERKGDACVCLSECARKLPFTSTAQLHVYVTVSVKWKAGDLQVRFSIFTNASPALSAFHWEKILCLSVSVRK